MNEMIFSAHIICLMSNFIIIFLSFSSIDHFTPFNSLLLGHSLRMSNFARLIFLSFQNFSTFDFMYMGPVTYNALQLWVFPDDSKLS